MSRRPVIGVIGSDDQVSMKNARELGTLIAENGWAVICGGRDSGVMKAVSEAADAAGGLTIGVLPNQDSEVAPGIKVAIITDMNNARNIVIGLSSNVVVACGVNGTGTASEVALALKNGKPVILLAASDSAITFFNELSENVHIVSTPRQAIDKIMELL